MRANLNIVLTLILLATVMRVSPAQAQTLSQVPVVHAVVFWMDTCGHCHYVLEEVLPPLQAQYGEQLEIALIEVRSTEDVERLYQTAAAFGIAKEKVGVPLLVIGDRILIGSAQIPAELPGLIESYLAAGGVDLPDITNLVEAVSSPDPGLPDRPDGFSLANGALVFMIAALLYTITTFLRGKRKFLAFRRVWLDTLFLVLAVAGMGVAGYLAYVETQAVSAVCGPVGDCNAVQSSSYARLFGVLPIGVLGLIGYLAILAGWSYPRLRADRLAQVAPLVVFGMASLGVLFSIYLTYLEPFVIRAVCIWCLTSAVIMTFLLLLSLNPAMQTLVASKEKT